MNMMEGCRACMFVGCTVEKGTVYTCILMVTVHEMNRWYLREALVFRFGITEANTLVYVIPNSNVFLGKMKLNILSYSHTYCCAIKCSNDFHHLTDRHLQHI